MYIGMLQRLDAALLTEAEQFSSAVAVVKYRDKWLLGFSRATDRRNKRWCMVGGHIKRGESSITAAVRECWEESGVRVKPLGGLFEMKGHPNVAFVPCVAAGTPKTVKPNAEFASIGWFKESELSSLRLFDNVKELIRRAKSFHGTAE